MLKVNFEETFEIYLFTDRDQEKNSSMLNEFLSFLKFHKKTAPYRFSYSSSNDGLIPELTLNENILMDFSPESLTTGREFQFQEFLKELPNQFLESLYKKIEYPLELPIHSSDQMKKICSLVKSLISEGQFIFLEEPEKNLDSECLAIFINCLKDNMARNKQNVFIFTTDKSLWESHAHQEVKREKNFSFKIEKINAQSKWARGKEEFYASYKKIPPNTKADNLLFHFPKNQRPKKSAA